ncbi:hypothetical protein [Prauserella endophytica]|uniref:Uncharacterized protein n=1 Tax=Prauserella endophytica TaxID=1592324 RepID=A0ABY2S060_9PSEU|nr:hypothetical protein [Prauserella endophytica]TKG67024.1 hypothetical protein FCN18_24265 [Prauserella endophytica]
MEHISPEDAQKITHGIMFGSEQSPTPCELDPSVTDVFLGIDPVLRRLFGFVPLHVRELIARETVRHVVEFRAERGGS